MKNLSIVLYFSIGAAAGSIVTWKLLRTKYEKLVKEEIESVKETFSRLNKHEESEEKEEVYHEIASNYIKESEEGEDMTLNDIDPYVIPPEEFGSIEEYDTESLTYYADGVLTDDFDNEIEDVDFMVGKDSLTHFGEYEDDSVFVRNDRIKTDFEILLDVRNFREDN